MRVMVAFFGGGLSSVVEIAEAERYEALYPMLFRRLGHRRAVLDELVSAAGIFSGGMGRAAEVLRAGMDHGIGLGHLQDAQDFAGAGQIGEDGQRAHYPNRQGAVSIAGGRRDFVSALQQGARRRQAGSFRAAGHQNVHCLSRFCHRFISLRLG